MYSAYRVCIYTCVILCRIRDKVTNLQKYNNAKLTGMLKIVKCLLFSAFLQIAYDYQYNTCIYNKRFTNYVIRLHILV